MDQAQGIMKIFGSAFNRGMARHEGNKLVKEARKARKYRQMELAEDLRALSKAQKYAEGEAIVQIAQTGVMMDSGTPQQFMSQMREIHRYNKAMMFLEGMHEADQISKDAHKERWNMYERAHQQNVSSWLGSDITNMAGMTPNAQQQLDNSYKGTGPVNNTQAMTPTYDSWGTPTYYYDYNYQGPSQDPYYSPPSMTPTYDDSGVVPAFNEGIFDPGGMGAFGGYV